MLNRAMVSSSTYVVSVLSVFLILQSVNANDLGDLLSPLLSPIFDNICKEVECGKGTCKPSGSSTFQFECECDSGWRRSPLSDDDDDDDHLKFLPCIIPNCTLNHACSKAPPPGTEIKPRTNESIFNPCRWADCGGGHCNKTSAFTYDCVCLEGYNNLLNVTAFPCFEECSIGLDCQKLGIPVKNQSHSPPPSSAAATVASRCVAMSSVTYVAILVVVVVLMLLK